MVGLLFLTLQENIFIQSKFPLVLGERIPNFQCFLLREFDVENRTRCLNNN